MEIFYTTQTDLPAEELAEKLSQLRPDIEKTYVNIIGTGCYENVLDLLLFKCRTAGLFKRKLLLPLPDVDVVCRLLLQNANKELTGDSIHTRSELLELRAKIEKSRKANSWPEANRESTVNLAAGRYQEFLKNCNLIDIWSVYAETDKIIDAAEPSGINAAEPSGFNAAEPSGINAAEPPGKQTVIFQGRISRLDVESLSRLNLHTASKLQFSQQPPTVSEPCSLDVVVEELENERTIEPTAETNSGGSISESEDGRFVLNLNSDCSGLQIWVGLLRLLVNTRDEISLARVLTLSGLLTADQCRVVRQETDKSNLAMYQYIVSYVTQASLGGNNAPGEEHPFFEFELQISELVKLMEKLQEKLEETPNPSAAVEKVTSTVKGWLQKNGVSLRKVDINEVLGAVSGQVMSRQTGVQGTPARGILGKPGQKLVTGLVDLFSVVVEEEGVEAAALSKTPARNKLLVNFFRTPQQVVMKGDEVSTVADDMDEFDIIANKEGVGEKLKSATNTPEPGNNPTYARFKSSLGWALESSPVPESAGRIGVRVGGSTLVSAAAPDTPLRSMENVENILLELEEKQEEERKQEMKELLKVVETTRTKSRKRILASEAEEQVKKKFGVENENEPKKQKTEKAVSKPKAKKKLSTPKGQRKLTSFFTKA